MQRGRVGASAGRIAQIRGFLVEHGITFAKAPANPGNPIPAILEDSDQNRRSRMRNGRKERAAAVTGGVLGPGTPAHCHPGRLGDRLCVGLPAAFQSTIGS